MRKVVWLDSWDQVWLLQARPERWSRVGPGAYFRAHGLAECPQLAETLRFDGVKEVANGKQ